METKGERHLAVLKMVEKVRNLTDKDLQTIWTALGRDATWSDPNYNQYITLEEWAESIYSELTYRGLGSQPKPTRYRVTKTYRFKVSYLVEAYTPEDAETETIPQADFLEQLWKNMTEEHCKLEEWGY